MAMNTVGIINMLMYPANILFSSTLNPLSYSRSHHLSSPRPPPHTPLSAPLLSSILINLSLGTCNVPSRVDYQMRDGTVCKLGRWLDRQRERQRAGTYRVQE